MRRAITAMFIGVASTLVVGTLGVSSSVAGGGCHGRATQGTGDTVEMVDACFTPSLLRTNPGSEVTFLNRDPFAHNISANMWGYFGDLEEGDAYTARFNRPGIYPFACTYHPGMTGAIVVGDAARAGFGGFVGVAGGEATPEAASTAASTSVSQSGPRWSWLGGGGVGLVLGAASMVLVQRRRRMR